VRGYVEDIVFHALVPASEAYTAVMAVMAVTMMLVTRMVTIGTGD